MIHLILCVIPTINQSDIIHWQALAQREVCCQGNECDNNKECIICKALTLLPWHRVNSDSRHSCNIQDVEIRHCGYTQADWVLLVFECCLASSNSAVVRRCKIYCKTTSGQTLRLSSDTSNGVLLRWLPLWFIIAHDGDCTVVIYSSCCITRKETIENKYPRLNLSWSV